MRTPRSREIYEGFAKRLNYSLQQKGFVSEHAKSGVRIKQLAKTAGCSLQMAHRYINGEAMPDYMALKAVADWLEISAGWLVYGETTPLPKNQKTKMMLEVETLQYVLNAIYALHIPKNNEKITEFVMDLLNQLIQMDCDRKVMEQYVNGIVKSIKHSRAIGLGI